MSSDRSTADEYQTPRQSEGEQVSIEASALNQRAMNNAYVGQDQLRVSMDQAEWNNIQQRLRQQYIQRQIDKLNLEEAWSIVDYGMDKLGYTTADFSEKEIENLKWANYDTDQMFKKQEKVSQRLLSKIAEQMAQDKEFKKYENFQGIGLTPQLAEEAQTMISPTKKATKKELLRRAEQNATQYTRRSTRGKEKLTQTEQRNMERDQRRLARNRVRERAELEESQVESKYDISNGVRASDEYLGVGVSRVRAQQPSRSSQELVQLPPGMGYTPFGTQGTANYDPMAQWSEVNSQVIDNLPSRREVNNDEIRFAPIRAKYDQQDIDDKVQEMRFRISDLGAEGEQLIDRFGQIEGYLSSIYDLILAGEEPENILSNTLQELYGDIPPSLIDDVHQRDGRMREVLDEEKFINDIGVSDPALREQILNEGRKIVNGDLPNNRNGNEMDFPDLGGAPLSSSTGTDTDGKYEDYGNSFHDPENDGYSYSRYHGDDSSVSGISGISGVSGGGGGGGGGGASGSSFLAMQNLYKLAPHIAQLLTNQTTRPLYIKKMDIKSIYPPPPKHTNLAIVQQSIAKYEEEASLLNVYFS